MTAEQTYDDDAVLAAEYALGLLTGEELATAARRAATDPVFSRSVTDWEIRLAALTDDLPDVAPSPATKRALLARVMPVEAAPSWWQRLWVWQGISALSACALAVVLLTDVRDPAAARGPLYTAEIVSDEGDFRTIAVVDKSLNEVFLTRVAGEAPAGRILQVWAHGPDAPATSVGLWPEGTTVRLRLSDEIAAVDGVLTLGVSEEPIGGSPTGSPSGRVFGTVDIPNVRPIP